VTRALVREFLRLFELAEMREPQERLDKIESMDPFEVPLSRLLIEGGLDERFAA
jgi:hypothetical protein